MEKDPPGSESVGVESINKCLSPASVLELGTLEKVGGSQTGSGQASLQVQGHSSLHFWPGLGNSSQI